MSKRRAATGKAFVLEDVLAAIRALETNESAVILLGDDDVFRVLVAWQHTDQEWTKPSGDPPTIVAGKMGRLWSWIRSGWTIDEDEIAEIAGLGLGRVHEKLAVLIGTRMIYPDGSIAKAAKAALQVHTATKLGVKQKPRPSPPSKPRKSDDEDDSNNDDAN